MSPLDTALPHLARPGSSGVEQRIENPRVGGSIPPPGTILRICQRILA